MQTFIEVEPEIWKKKAFEGVHFSPQLMIRKKKVWEEVHFCPQPQYQIRSQKPLDKLS